MIEKDKVIALKNKLFVLLLLAFSIFVLNVNADCDYTKQAAIKKDASSVKASYEILTEESDVKDDARGITVHNAIDTFKITIYNITNNMKVEKIIDGSEPEIITYDQTKNGKFTYYVTDIYNIQKHEFKIYSTDADCGERLLKTVSLIKPKLNNFGLTEVCEDIPEFSYCKKYIDKELNISEDAFMKAVVKYKNNLSMTTKKVEPKEKHDSNYIYYIIGGVALIAIGVAAYMIIQKKRSEF